MASATASRSTPGRKTWRRARTSSCRRRCAWPGSRANAAAVSGGRREQGTAMALPRSFTVTDLYAMPDSERGERYELIDGELFVNPAPRSRHQSVSHNLVLHLGTYVRSNRLGRVRDNSGVRVSESTYVIPDVVFVS